MTVRLPWSVRKKADHLTCLFSPGVFAVCLFLLTGIFCTPLRAQEDLRSTASQLNSQGGKAYEAGQYDRALDLFQRSLSLFQRLEDRQGIAAGLTNVGLIYATLGQHKKALEYYERALTMTPESDLRGIGVLLGNLGNLSNRTGQMEAAIRYFAKMLELAETQNDRRSCAIALDGLAQACSRLRQFDRALDYQMKALALTEQDGNLREIARILSNIGTTGKAKGDYNLAVLYLNRALELKRRYAGRAEIAGSLTNLALIYFDQGKLPESAAAFAETIEHNEAISREVRDASRVGDFQDWFRSSLYRRYAHVLINQKKPEEALVVLERGRGQGLARQAGQNRADFSQTLGETDSRRLLSVQTVFQQAADNLHRMEGQTLSVIEDSPQARLLEEARSRYAEAERLLRALRTELSERNPKYRQLSGIAPPTSATLKELAAKNPDTLYLQWAVGAEATSLLFTLSKKDGVHSFVLNVGEEALQKQVRAWRNAIQKGEPSRERAAAQVLYTSLFSAIEKAGLMASDRFSRLVLVGDGPLLEVPYGALLDGEGKRLIEKTPLSVAVSFGVLTWHEEPRKPAGKILIAADPFSPGASPLPAARKEGSQLAGLFPGARFLFGRAATRAQVLPELAKCDILHFATHGLLDNEDGLKCGLLLASNEDREELEILEARELIGTHLIAQMAVLSACDTGQGQRSGGEGLLGLTWAFRAAGCPSTVASLWSVDDDATGQLMALFYRELKEGKRKDEALRNAMLKVKQAHEPPLFWAAFQVNGSTGKLTL